MKLRAVLIYLVALAVALFLCYRTAHRDYYNAVTVTGATPIALAQMVPRGCQLSIDGQVQKSCDLGSSALRAFATTRIRTRELAPEGGYEGAYIYVGIPVFNILEGIAPAYPEGRQMNNPTDFMVTFTNTSGAQSHFTYNELIYTDDCLPVTLAYSGSPLLPSTRPDAYRKNLRTGEVRGLKLIAPRDADTGRFLDDVVCMTLWIPSIPETLLPQRQKGLDCSANRLIGIEGDHERELSLEGLELRTSNDWVRLGHGHGFDSISKVKGYGLGPFIRKNFPQVGLDDYVLFVSCDGYRSLFSAREIFGTKGGDNMLILTEMDGQSPRGGFMLACLDDFFVDRSIWGISHVVLLHPPECR